MAPGSVGRRGGRGGQAGGHGRALPRFAADVEAAAGRLDALSAGGEPDMPGTQRGGAAAGAHPAAVVGHAEDKLVVLAPRADLDAARFGVAAGVAPPPAGAPAQQTGPG